MHVRSFHVVIASAAILMSAVLAWTAKPRLLMARSTESFNLEQIVPKQFGEWTNATDIKLIEPPEPDSFARRLYSQEVSRAYRDREGHLVMFLVAYGPDQSARVQLHRPELCYAAAGFRVSKPVRAEVSYSEGAPPIKLFRLVARREARTEPISYWMRIGDENVTGIVERQIVRLKYGLFRGIVVDGALVRVSTLGLPEKEAYALQSRFMRDLFRAIAPEYVDFFLGSRKST